MTGGDDDDDLPPFAVAAVALLLLLLLFLPPRRPPLPFFDGDATAPPPPVAAAAVSLRKCPLPQRHPHAYNINNESLKMRRQSGGRRLYKVPCKRVHIPFSSRDSDGSAVYQLLL